MEPIGREREKKILQKLLNSEEAELLAVYGRRRIGKTFLIKEFFSDKGLFFELTGILRGRTSEQLWNFAETVTSTFKLKTPLPTPKNWQKAFSTLLEQLEKVPESQKVILFFDELPWLATRRSNMLRTLEYNWNRHLSRRKNLIVVLCGSAASWMIKKVVQNRGGLHGRLTQKIHLKPFSLLETENYLKAKHIFFDRKQLIELYMLTGGVAKYLNHIEKGRSSMENIQSLCFSPNGFLTDEFQPLFASLFDDSEKHLAIVKALAKSHKGLTLNALTKATSKTLGGHFTAALNDLESSGFIQSIPFFGRKKRDSLYRLLDEYSLFYLTWVDRKEQILNFHRSPKFLSWAGYAFENICIKHSRQIIEALKLPLIAKSLSYWDKQPGELPGAQIDLVIERTDRCINLLEMKFCEDEFTITKEYGRLLNQRRSTFSQILKSKRTIFNTLVTPFGAAKSPPYLSAVDQELTLDALFSY
ncbi:AAA family ATPase [Candidatus Neptunochlamydia vexilliferae]|nr:ATP-binding protein [Candidatus Neptunochlamydia vexilliferae]